MINVLTDLLEVPGLCILLVFASDALILDSQPSHGGPQIRTLNSIHLHVQLLIGQTSLKCIQFLQKKVIMMVRELQFNTYL